MLKNTKSDYSVLVVLVITGGLLSLMLFQHQWSFVEPLANPIDKPILTLEIPDFSSVHPVNERKAAFLAFMRPLIRQENQQIRYDKANLKSLVQALSEEVKQHAAPLRKLKSLARKYNFEIENIESGYAELALRVDIIPESLVLAQAAIESGWGTSKFAQSANNLFGERCFSHGCGIVPELRLHTERFQVRKFDSAQASVQSYFRNINTHYAYQELRELRAQQQNQQKQLTGIKLASALENYSERGEAYVKDIVSLIERNNLE